jgi:cardiolipin synthase
MNLPNALTILRILLVPLFAILVFKKLTLWALMVFVSAGLTDGLDGYIARKFHLKTKMGAFLDPLADKLLLLTAFVVLTGYEHFPVWLSGIVVGRDMVTLTGIICIYVVGGTVHFSPSILGKATTLAQLLTIIFFLLTKHVTMLNSYLPPIYFVTTAVTLVSGAHYIYVGIKTVFSGEVSLNGEG